MTFKFEKLEVWQLALDYIDAAYDGARQLPRSEEFNLRSQLTRAATSVALNIAEGSTGQTNAEQSRFLGLALRSLIETVACEYIIRRQQLLPDAARLDPMHVQAERLFAKLGAMRRSLEGDRHALREAQEPYAAIDTGELDEALG